MANQDKIQDLEAKIYNETHYIGIKTHAHNLIGCYLRQLRELTNRDYVEEIIVENSLHKLGWYVSDEAWEKTGELRFTDEEVREYTEYETYVNETLMKDYGLDTNYIWKKPKKN